jgi:hypothetical protein
MRACGRQRRRGGGGERQQQSVGCGPLPPPPRGCLPWEAAFLTDVRAGFFHRTCVARFAPTAESSQRTGGRASKQQVTNRALTALRLLNFVVGCVRVHVPWRRPAGGEKSWRAATRGNQIEGERKSAQREREGERGNCLGAAGWLMRPVVVAAVALSLIIPVT